jgi:hypothetical protein
MGCFMPEKMGSAFGVGHRAVNQKLPLQNEYLIAETVIQMVAEMLEVIPPDGHLGHLLDNRRSISRDRRPPADI